MASAGSSISKTAGNPQEQSPPWHLAATKVPPNYKHPQKKAPLALPPLKGYLDFYLSISV